MKTEDANGSPDLHNSNIVKCDKKCSLLVSTVLDKKTVIIKSTNNAGTIYYLITDAPC